MGAGGVFASFFKVGVIGFGGGSALIPVVEKEVVHAKKWMDDSGYLKHTVVANITPGALPVKLGATCGFERAGVPGGLVGAYGTALPGVALTVAIMALFSLLGEQAISWFHYASVGISAFIVFLLFAYVQKTLKVNDFKINLALCLCAFALTGGGEVRALIAALGGPASAPLLDISTINLMVLAFYMIVLLTLSPPKPALFAGAALGLGYAVLSGKAVQRGAFAALGARVLLPALLVLMLALLGVLALLRWRAARGKPKGKTARIPGKIWLCAALFLLAPLALTTASALITQNFGLFGFVGKVCLSTITSFGGGEAYVSVADGIFVQGGYIAPEMYYTRLVPVANALPGPILIKVAAGIGYVYGSAGGALVGWLVAACATLAAVGTCSAVALVVLSLFDVVGHSAFILNLKRYILPVICGMLLSTSLAILVESIKILAGKNVPGLLGFGILALWVAGLLLLTKKRHVNDLILLLVSAGASLAALLLI